MKMIHICICSRFYKHGCILLKFGMQVTIGYGKLENEYRVIGKSKIPPRMQKWAFLDDMGIHMRSLGDRVN